MKNKIVTILIICGALTMPVFLSAQQTSGNRTITKEVKDVQYTTSDPGWSWDSNSIWLYNGEKTELTPLNYTGRLKVDKIIIKGSNDEIHECILTTVQSTGTYETKEPGWKWNKHGWTFDGSETNAFPPAYIRKVRIETTYYEPCEKQDEYKNKKVEEIVEDYMVTAGWSWDAGNGKWLLNGNDAEILPSYTKVRSIYTTKNK